MITNKEIALLSFSLGALVGTLVTRYYMKNKCEEYIHEEVAAIKKKERESRKEFIGKVEEEIEANNKQYMLSKRKVENDVKYSKVDRQTDEEIEIEDEEDYEEISNEERWRREGEEIRAQGVDIYKIDEDDYINALGGSNDQCALTYYKGDGVLADELDDMINDIDNVISLEALEEALDNGEEEFYVRNLRLTIDYEIRVVEGSYHKIVENIDDDGYYYDDEE